MLLSLLDGVVGVVTTCDSVDIVCVVCQPMVHFPRDTPKSANPGGWWGHQGFGSRITL